MNLCPNNLTNDLSPKTIVGFEIETLQNGDGARALMRADAAAVVEPDHPRKK
jgi:hypothetical protein